MVNSNLQQVDFSHALNMIRSGELSFYNFYNADIPVNQHYSVDYYLNHPNDTMEVDQIITTSFTDIELYNPNDEDFDFKAAHLPINAITIVDSVSKEYHAFFLLYDFNMELFGIKHDNNFDFKVFIAGMQAQMKQFLVDKEYLTEDSEIFIYIFDQESELIKSYWSRLMTVDPCIISGWNSDLFDYPYLYGRTVKLFGAETANRMITKLGHVTQKGDLVVFPEYINLDLLYAYKPRDEGGLNLGKKQSQYTLDNISSIELKLKKIEYKSENVSLNELYEKDPYWFLLYNIADTALTYLLNDKLKHIELYNTIRRIMRCGYGSSIIGSSATFESMIFSQLIELGKYVRYGINTESKRSLDENMCSNFPKLNDPKGKQCKIPAISSKVYSSAIRRFPGAYVKEPTPKIVNDGSLVIDLDAKALYPSMILQSNISFDSYIARIIPPCTYKTLVLLENSLGKTMIPDMLSQNVANMCWLYSDTVRSQKRDTAITMYNIILYLFSKLYSSGLTFQQICSPREFKEHVYLRHYLIPLLDALNIIHPENKTFNQFAYDYLFMDRYDSNNVDLLQRKYPAIYILFNPADSNAYVQKFDLVEGIKTFQQYGLTLAGTLFTRHEEYMGLFTNFLISMGNLRTKYKDARQECTRGTDEYDLNDNRQKSFKVVMNTTYGLYGLSTFRYSNHWLAQSITNNGMLTIKIAQQLGESYLNYKYGN